MTSATRTTPNGRFIYLTERSSARKSPLLIEPRTRWIMDVPISPALRHRCQRRRWLLGGGVVAALALATLGLSRLQPALPRVEKASLFLGTVQRGEMLRQVRGNGTLVPEDIRWIPTVNAGRVERILVLPGARVKADAVLVE